MSAARLARGFTGREIIVKFTGNYHGSTDSFLVKAGSGLTDLSSTSSSEGVPNAFVQHTISLGYNDIEGTRNFLTTSPLRNNIAAVIVEPVAGNMGVVPANPDFITMIREESRKIGALLIFDEVITGFRLSLQGAQGLYNVRPDLTCLGKIMGGGFPAAAFGGRADIMDYLAPQGPVYQAGTLSGNPVAMEAGLQTIQLLERDGFYEELANKATVITRPVQQAFLRHNIEASVQQAGSMFTIFWGKKNISNMEDVKSLDKARFNAFFRFMFERGVYIPPSQYEASFVSEAHTMEQLERTRDLILEFIQRTAL
jgi:glutamate-1-semialdehyde 2,1-aminomutase